MCYYHLVNTVKGADFLISYIKGSVEHISDSFIILECYGIGYTIKVSTATIAKIQPGSEIKMYTYMSVREDDVSLFGFLAMDELEMFNKLLTVNGLGPKSALSILATITPAQLMLAVVTDDSVTLSKCPGVGKKTAQRIILDLRDKIKTQEAIGMEESPVTANVSSGHKQDAIDAMIALGYSRSDAVKAVLEVSQDGLSTEQLIRLALKRLSSL